MGKSFDTAEEFAGLDFYSLRLENRFIRTMETLERSPEDAPKMPQYRADLLRAQR